MIEGVRWKVSCKRTKSPVLSHWIIIALEASDILRDKFSMRVIIQWPKRQKKKKKLLRVLSQSINRGQPFLTQLNRIT